MFWLNHVVIGGVIASTPSIEHLNGVEVMTLSLRTIRPLATRTGGQAHFFTVKCYDAIAKYVLSKFRKNSAVVIDGELNEQSYVDEIDMKRRTRTVVVAHRIFSAIATTEEEAELSAAYLEAQEQAKNSRPSKALANAQADQGRRERKRSEENQPLGRNSEMAILEPQTLSIAT